MRHLLRVLFLSWVLLLKVACNGTSVCMGTACTMVTCVGAACDATPYAPPPPPLTQELSGFENVCEAQRSLATKLGVNRMVMGVMTELGGNNYENYIRDVPYGLKYLYLANGVLRTEICSSCNNCPGNSMNWWGCWASRNNGSPGGHLTGLFSTSEAAGQIPMVVYYTFVQSMNREGSNALRDGLLDVGFLRAYLNDWRFVLSVVKEYQDESHKPVMLNIEPDLWGYAQQGEAGRNGPEGLQARVKEAAGEDCPTEADNFAGFARCMIRMARTYAPEATLGLLASGWATGLGDISLSTATNMDVEFIAKTTSEYLNKLGANLGDFLVVEFSDRDAGYYAANGQRTRWYDVNNVTFPNFHRTFLWGKTLANEVKLPLVWWQIPMGHMGLNNTSGHWQDNRVDYLFSHLSEVAATQTIALAFGPGRNDQTTPATDGGNLANHVLTYAEGPGQELMCIQP